MLLDVKLGYGDGVLAIIKGWFSSMCGQLRDDGFQMCDGQNTRQNMIKLEVEEPRV